MTTDMGEIMTSSHPMLLLQCDDECYGRSLRVVAACDKLLLLLHSRQCDLLSVDLAAQADHHCFQCQQLAAVTVGRHDDCMLTSHRQ